MNNVIPFPIKRPIEECLWQAQATLCYTENQYKIAQPWQFEIMPTIYKNNEKPELT